MIDFSSSALVRTAPEVLPLFGGVFAFTVTLWIAFGVGLLVGIINIALNVFGLIAAILSGSEAFASGTMLLG